MSTLALVFPGQGSQVVGMGKDVSDAWPNARGVFARADETLGFKLSDICWSGPEDVLRDTINQQPALLTTSVAVLRALEDGVALRPGLTLEPAFVAGHSLGEYSALVAVGSLTFTDAVRLVRERGRLMKLAGESHPGAMAAVIGLDDASLEDVCRQASERSGGLGVVCANYNSPGQVVISGEIAALETAAALAKERGARRVIPLPVTIASHSPLMKEAAEAFAQAVQSVKLHAPRIPVIGNVTAQPLHTVADIRHELVTQLTSPVRWTASVQYMVAQGVRSFWEVGPKDVLTGLIKRIDPSIAANSLGDVAGLDRFLAGGV